MKRTCIIALALVLGCILFTGCRRGNGNMDTISPTNQTVTTPAARPTSPAATMPATQAPTQDMTEGSTNDGSTENATENGTQSGTDNTMPRSRGMIR